MAIHNDIGKWGEDVAANLLTQKGYRILERNWHIGHLEVDIIAQEDDTVIFVEVKTRTTTFGDKLPEEYVDKEKETNVCKAAGVYIKQHRIDGNVRFDIISILVDSSTLGINRLEHIENAFYPPLRTIDSYSYSHSYSNQYKRKRRFLI